MRQARKIFNLVYREAFNPVFTSQVLRPVEWLLNHGENVWLGVFSTFGDLLRPRTRRRWHALLNGAEHRVAERVRRLPCRRHPRSPRWWDATVLGAWLLAHHPHESIILHCRNELMTAVALYLRQRLSSVRVILDYRGLSHAEFLLGQRSLANPHTQARAQKIYELERRVAQEADSVLCVSDRLASYVSNDYGVPRERIHVVPCCVEARRFAQAVREREATRSALGLGSRLTVVYCGSLQHWQRPETCAQVFRMTKMVVPSAHYLVLTTEPGKMADVAGRSGLNTASTTILRADASEVPRYLAAADVGLLLRESCIVNEMSSPVKFGEYLASGLPVIMNTGIGDYSELAAKEGVGVVLPNDKPVETWIDPIVRFLEEYRRSQDELRRRCREVAERQLSWDVHLPRVVDLYQRLPT